MYWFDELYLIKSNFLGQFFSQWLYWAFKSTYGTILFLARLESE